MESALPLASPAVRRSSLPPVPDLDDVFARFLDPVYAFLYRRVGNREDAEDLTSEVFLRAARQLDTERTEASMARWLFTVARTVLADHWRRYYQVGVSVPFDETVENRVDIPTESAPSEGTEQLVADVLGRLSDRYRQVLELRFLRGLSVQETAREMAITPENVKVLQHRALAKAVQRAEGML